MAEKSFEEGVLEMREEDRKRFSEAFGAMNGAAPYSKTLSEEEQDRLWMFVAEPFRDPILGQQRLMQLTLPQEQGGMGLTPLAASLEKYPHRRLLYEGAGASIDDHILYANKRAERIARKPPAAPPPTDQPTSTPPAEGY